MNPNNILQVDTTLANITGGVSCGVPGHGQHLQHTGSRRIDRIAARTSVPSGSSGGRAPCNATLSTNRSHASSSFFILIYKTLAACVAASCSTAACEAASASCNVTSCAIISLTKAASAGDRS